MKKIENNKEQFPMGAAKSPEIKTQREYTGYRPQKNVRPNSRA